MELIITGLIILIIICFITMWFITTYNRYQMFIIKTNEVEASIDAVLRKRFDLLNKAIGIIKGNCEVNDEVLDIIVKLRSRKLTNFELDRLLYDAISEFHRFKEEYPILATTESFVKIEDALNESEPEIVALRKYYNDIITEYNKYIKKIPTNLVAKVCKYKYKPYFDGKDMTDNIINDFKL